MIAIIPVDHSIQRYPPDRIPIFNVAGAVKVNLARDGEHIGSVTFGVHATPTNPRATEATYLLTGAYVRVQGEAMFEVADEALLTEVLEAL